MPELDATITPLRDWIADHAVRIGIAVGAAALIVLLLHSVKHLLLRAANRLAGHRSWPALIASVVRRTRLWFLIALAARLVQGYANAPELVAQTISFVFVIAATFQVAIWARTVVLGLIEHRAGHDGHDANIASAMTIIQLLVSFAVFAIAAIFVLDNLGVNVTGLVAGLGVGGIAIGLAAQGIFGDLFAALSILFDRPFQVGETITFQGKEGPVTGVVERIGLKSTRIRGQSGELRIIANAKLLEQELTNLTGRAFHRLAIRFGLIYQTDPQVLETLPDLLKEIVERHGHDFVRGTMIGFGPSSLDYELVFDCRAPELNEARSNFQTIALAVLAAFNARGIEFAYPTQTSFTAAPDGTLIMPYPSAADERESQVQQSA